MKDVCRICFCVRKLIGIIISALEVFRNMCLRYNSEVEIIQSVNDKQPLGMLYLQMEKLKKGVLPEPRRLITIIQRTMPKCVYTT